MSAMLRRAGAWACAVGAAALLAAPAAAKDRAPFRAVLAVRWGHGAGSDTFRDDFARAAADALSARCFTGVVVAGEGHGTEEAELDLEILLSDAYDETRYDDTIAGALQPGEPTQELRRVARYSVAVDLALFARADGALILRKDFVTHAERRPVYIGEDPQATVREEVIRDSVDATLRKLGCGSPKLTKRIAAVLAPKAAGAR